MKKLLVGLLLLGVSVQGIVKAEETSPIPSTLYTKTENLIDKLNKAEISVEELQKLINTIKSVRDQACSVDEIMTKTLLENQDTENLNVKLKELETQEIKAKAKALAEEAKAYVEAKKNVQPATKTINKRSSTLAKLAKGTGVIASLAAAPVGYVGTKGLLANGFNRADAGLAAALLPAAGLTLYAATKYVVAPVVKTAAKGTIAVVKNVVVKPTVTVAKATGSFAIRHPWVTSIGATLSGTGIAAASYFYNR